MWSAYCRNRTLMKSVNLLKAMKTKTTIATLKACSSLMAVLGLLLVPRTGLSASIFCGQTVTTNTSYYSELDAYSYAGSAGQVLSVALWGPTDCGAFTENDSMEADIYSPSGQLLTTLVSGCTGAALNLTLTN